jgi:hypothetical protein
MRPLSDSVGDRIGTFCFGTSRSSGSRPLLESAINCFEPLKRIDQLQTGLTGLVRARHELFHVLGGESDPVDRDAPDRPLRTQ